MNTREYSRLREYIVHCCVVMIVIIMIILLIFITMNEYEYSITFELVLVYIHNILVNTQTHILININ